MVQGMNSCLLMPHSAVAVLYVTVFKLGLINLYQVRNGVML